MSGAPTNVKAVAAINKAASKEDVPADECEALITALEACNKGDSANGLLPHVRQRGLVYLPGAIASGNNEATLAGKALLAVVNTLVAESSSEIIRSAAVDCLSAVAAACQAKQAEVTREVTDVLLQVSLADSGFSQDLRTKALAQVTGKLVEACPRGVVAKMLHWLSDDREDDTAAQITAERDLAFTILESQALRKPAAVQALQQDETIPKIGSRVLSVVSAAQFTRLLPTVLKFMHYSDASLSTLVDSVCGAKFDNVRAWESFMALAQALPRSFNVPNPAAAAHAAAQAAAASADAEKKAEEPAAAAEGAEKKEGESAENKTAADAAPAPPPATIKQVFHCDTPLERISAVVAKKGALDASDATVLLKAFAAAAALASNDGAAKKVAAAKDVLAKVMTHSALSQNFSAIEAALIAFAAVACRSAEAVAANVDDKLADNLKQFAENVATPTYQQYNFAVKKEGKVGAPKNAPSAVASLENCKSLAEKLSAKAAVEMPAPSWVTAFRASHGKGARRGVFDKALESAVGVRAREGGN